MAAFALWVTCRACGQAFDSGLRMDKKSFGRGTLATNYHTCPNCGVRETYRKHDYDLRSAAIRGRAGKQDRSGGRIWNRD